MNTMEEDFYASIKLVSGEEIFARVIPCEEDGKINLLLTNPITFCEIKNRSGETGYKVEPWIKTTSEDMFIIDLNNVITMTESNDLEIIKMHQSFVRKFNNVKNKRPNISRKMGYISNVNDAKELLEKIFKNY